MFFQVGWRGLYLPSLGHRTDLTPLAHYVQWNPSIVATMLSLIEGVALSQGLKECIWDSVAYNYIEGCPHIRGGLYEGFHCTYTYM